MRLIHDDAVELALERSSSAQRLVAHHLTTQLGAFHCVSPCCPQRSRHDDEWRAPMARRRKGDIRLPRTHVISEETTPVTREMRAYTPERGVLVRTQHDAAKCRSMSG
jgi:hypothetical protein